MSARRRADTRPGFRVYQRRLLQPPTPCMQKYMFITTEPAPKVKHFSRVARQRANARNDDVVMEDGTYDVFIVDVERDEEDANDDRVRFDLTITTGAHKGELITVTRRGAHDDPLDLIGLPGTLRVAGGQPQLEVDR